MPYIYSGSELFVFPSTTDTFGVAVLEAQGCGLPVIVSSKGGPQELIQHKKTGLIVKTEELTDWIDTVNRVLNIILHNPDAYAKMRSDARNLVVDKFSLKNFILGLFSEEEADLPIGLE